MIKIDPATWNWDVRRLPEDARLALLGRFRTAEFIRLTETLWAFRPTPGAGSQFVGTIEELLPLLLDLPPSTPYTRPVAAARIELDFSDIDFSALDGIEI